MKNSPPRGTTSVLYFSSAKESARAAICRYTPRSPAGTTTRPVVSTRSPFSSFNSTDCPLASISTAFPPPGTIPVPSATGSPFLPGAAYHKYPATHKGNMNNAAYLATARRVKRFPRRARSNLRHSSFTICRSARVGASRDKRYALVSPYSLSCKGDSPRHRSSEARSSPSSVPAISLAIQRATSKRFFNKSVIYSGLRFI